MAPTGTIGMITHRYAPAVGGVEKHAEILARGLVERGVPVEIITTDPTTELPHEEVRDGVSVRRFGTVGNDDVFYVTPSLGRWLSKNAHRYALIHAHSYHTPLAWQAARAAKKHGVPFVVTPHYHGTGHTPLRKLMHLPYRFIGAWMLKQARQIICVSEVERELINAHFDPGLPTTVIPNGVEFAPILEASPHAHDPERKVILSAGRMEFYKQTDRLVEAAPYLPDNYDIVIAGDGPAREGLQTRIQELGLGDRVQLPGYISRADLLSWFRTADVFVSMSKNEAFGITVLEGAAGGALVVASDIPAHREIADTYVAADILRLVAIDATPQVLAAAIKKAAGEKPNSDVSSWSLPTWEGAIDGALRIYEAVLGTTLTPQPDIAASSPESHRNG